MSTTSTLLDPGVRPAASGPCDDDEIIHRIEHCPKLASLESVNRKLAGLVNSENGYTSQIADIIRRDPSLTARLLRMVNSVYFGLSAKVNNIEEAVLYMGLRQIRELSMATPVVEELERLGGACPALPWRELWQHSIGSAILTREILAHADILVDDDTDYIIGLLHNVGKVLLATLWPQEFAELSARDHADPDAVCAAERALVGWDHAMIGAHYLRRHQLAPEIVQAVRHHVAPHLAGEYQNYAAAVQIADLAVRETGIRGGFERLHPLPAGAWSRCPGWTILFPQAGPAADAARDAVQSTLARLPSLLGGLV